MMGKQGGKSRQSGGKSGNSFLKHSNISENIARSYDKDTIVFIAMSRELRDEGNKLFQKRDYEGAMLKYDKAIKLLPRNHIDVSCLRSNIAACYMQMGLSEYPRAIHECNLALEVTPKYSKALLKRARCYEALNRLDLAFRDVATVLSMEPNNVMATEISERVKMSIAQQGSRMDEMPMNILPVSESISLPSVMNPPKVPKEKSEQQKMEEKKVNDMSEENAANEEVANKEKADDRSEGSKDENKVEEEAVDRTEGSKDENIIEEEAVDRTEGSKDENIIAEEADDISEVSKEENIIEEETEYKIEDKKAEDKLVVEERITKDVQEETLRTVKLVFGEDIRWAQVPFNCSILKLREIISDRFPSLNAVLVKYRDNEGDLVTITTSEELRWAEAAAEHSSLRLYVVEVNPDQDPLYNQIRKECHNGGLKQNKMVENGNVGGSNGLFNRPTCISDWIICFANLFKNIVGVDTDSYLDLHEVGMKLYSEAFEETITSEEAQDLFSLSAEKFQEMAALALFNWANVHMSRARKRVYFSDDASRESVLAQVKDAYDWAQKEYSEAGKQYEEALKIKPNFYEGVLALGQQRFEAAKLSWNYAISTNVDLESWASNKVLQLYNDAEEYMELGMHMWEEAEKDRLTSLYNGNRNDTLLQKIKLDGVFKDISEDEATDQTKNMRSQINLLWGTMLYERSMMEFKLGLPGWEESLDVAVEKFEDAGASRTDIAVMMKNHCSNNTNLEGLGFNINEIVQAWNEMYEAKRWQRGFPSFRLEPLLRRRVSQLHYALEHL